MKKNTYVLTRGAMLLALALLFQSLRAIFPGAPPPVMQWIVGPLVNVALILSAYYCGLWVSCTISAATAVLAFMLGHLPNAWFIPCVAVGNAVLCIVFYLLNSRGVYKGLYQKLSEWSAVIAAAIAKFAALYVLMVCWAIPAIVKAPEAAAALSAAFSLPQLFTSLIGGALAVTLIKLIPQKKL